MNTITSDYNVIELNIKVYKILEWLKLDKLSLNIGKAKAMVFNTLARKNWTNYPKLDRGENTMKSKLKEAIQNKKCNPPLNQECCMDLPQIYGIFLPHDQTKSCLNFATFSWN